MDLFSDSIQVVHKGYRVPNCPYVKIVDLYHQILPILPTVVILNESRKRHISARWREVCAEDRCDEDEALAFFKAYFELVAKSRFLTGRTQSRDGRVFKADLEWLVKPNNFAKTIEGRYA